jgi:RNA polymerase sigma-70 factor (ECF subfamily)
MSPLEKQLWEKIQEGDLHAFRILFDTYYPLLLSHAYGILLVKEDAEEVAMDLFSDLWNHRTTIQIDFSLKSYLVKSIHNRCLNLLRQQKTRGRKVNLDLYDLVHAELTDKGNSIVENLEGKEMEKEILHAVDSLPSQCREVFYLSRFKQMKIKEIAAYLKISESTVKTQLARALEKLSARIKRHE